MPKIVKKVSAKRKAADPEEMKSVALAAIEKMKARQKQIVIAGVVVLAILIVYAAFSMHASSLASDAYELQQQADAYYYGDVTDSAMSQADIWKKALDLYAKSIEIRPSPGALYGLGNTYYNLEDYDNAIKTYLQFTAEFSSDSGILPLVYQKLASVYLKKGQNDDALSVLEKLEEVQDGIFMDTALIREARYYEGADNKEKAMEIYRKIMAEYPSSPWAVEASSRVSAEEAKQKDKSAETPDKDKPAAATAKASSEKSAEKTKKQ